MYISKEYVYLYGGGHREDIKTNYSFPLTKQNMKNAGYPVRNIGKYSYDGDWVDDKKEGNGFEIYENGESYCGYFKNDKKNGRGVYVFKNKNTYKGEWKNDKMNGKGVFKNSDGIETEGLFENGKLIEDKNNNSCFIF